LIVAAAEDSESRAPDVNGVSLVRAINQQLVLEAVLAAGEVTRAGLSRETGLSKPTVSSLVRSLERCGLVRRQGVQAGTIGRPATVYTVDRLAGHTYAVDLGGTKLRAAVTDLFGEILAEETVPTPPGHGQRVIDTIGAVYAALARRAGVEPEAATAACIGVPGVVRPADSEIDSAFNIPGLDGFPLRDALCDRLAMSVVVENDANLAAVGERWRGHGRGCDHFVAISIGTGIGMGIVVDGELYRGGSGGGGEIGFLPVVGDPFDPANKTHGPLEHAAASAGVRRRLTELLARHPASRLTAAATVKDIFAAADEGDPLGTRLVDEEARLIALGVAAVGAVIDPRRVVLSGGIGANTRLLEPVRDYLTQLLPHPPDVKVSSLGDRASLYGAIALAVDRMRQKVLQPRGEAATAAGGPG